MKKLMLIALLVLVRNLSFGQNVSINTTGDPAHASAMLDITSTDKGILIPRMAGFQRAMIVNPAQGLLVYDTDSRSFWYYDGQWKEIAAGSPSGPAGGDLSGNYPTPNVVKLQNLDVAFGVPNDKQVLKWDALANNWKGRNDSLFLPYNASFSDPVALLSVTNNFNGFSYSTALRGRQLNGSGTALTHSTGVWGDAESGIGVIGTSKSLQGMYGHSIENHGIEGQSSASSKAGVYGQNTGAFGTGVLGQSDTGFGIGGLSNGQDKAGVVGSNTHNGSNVYGVIGLIENGTGGAAVFGKNNSPGGHAGLFTNGNTSNIDHTLKVTNAGNGAAGYFTTSGMGPAGYFVSTNPSCINPSIFVSNSSNGAGMLIYQNASNTTHGLWVIGNGTGKSIYSTTEGGEAGVFEIVNPANENTSLTSSTTGEGKAAVFIKNNTSGSISDLHEPAVKIENISKGNALKVISDHTPSVSSAIDVQYTGSAFGINVNANKLGLHAITSEADGASVVAENYGGGYAMKASNAASQKGAVRGENSHMFGIGLEGHVTGSQAYAIKGTANTATAAIFGENAGESGVAVKGRTTADFGYAILGETTNTSNGIPAHFISNNPEALTNTLWVRDQSKGQTVRIQIDNELNAKEALYIKHDGTGKLASFNHDGEKAAIANNGNITTAGSVTVKGNKGIIRNSSSTQMRVETVNAIFDPAGSETLSPLEFRDIDVTFSNAFSSAPVVYIANITQNGNASSMLASVINVTTTGCTLHFVNPMGQNIAVSDSTWKLIAMGAE